MNAKPIVAGVAAGVAIAAGGMVAFDAVSEPADAQGSAEVTQADLRSANQRSIRAIKQGTTAWNLVAKYLAQPGERVAANSPRVRQEAGVGGGIPGPLIAAATIDESRLSDGVRAKLNVGGQPGPQGPQGPQGSQGAPGAQGPPGSLAGPAGGDLTGTFPDPEIADGVVGPQQLAQVPAASVLVQAGGFSVPNQASPRTDVQLRSSGGIDGFATPGITVDTTLDRFVVDTPGIYHLQARVQWNDPDAVGANDGDPGFRQIVVTRQFGATGAGATDIGAIDGGTVSDPTQIGSWYADLDAGDRVSVDVVQQTGAPQEVSGGSRISLVWVGPA